MKHLYPLLFAPASLLLVLLAVQAPALAQGSNSAEVVNGYMAVASGCTHASAGQNLYIGPGTYLINGTWQVYSKNIWISPAAILSGSGTIRFYNPSAAGGTAAASLMDGNNSGNFINVNMAIANASGMVLTDSPLPAAFTAAGWVDVSGNASLSAGMDVNFQVANGNLLTGNYDLTLSNTGTLSGYQENRFVVTAGSGHLVKQNFTGAFVFPVGMAAGDYTPAQINNAVANTFHVNVTNYSGVNSGTFATATTSPAEGINRGWNIYAASAAGNSTIDLEHNDSTEGSSYHDNLSFVTRLIGTRPNSAGNNTSNSYWESNTQGAGSGNGTLTTGATITTASERSRAYTSFATTAAAYIGWFTKSSDMLSPLPATLNGFQGRMTVCGEVQLDWTAENEQRLLTYEAEQSADGARFSSAGTAGAHNLPGTQHYSLTSAQYPATAYYRLKITDANGGYHYSNTITVTMHCSESTARVYPVPFSSTLVVQAGPQVKAVKVFDMLGRMLLTAMRTPAAGALQLDARQWPPGTYLVQLLNTNGSMESLPAVKQ